MAVLGRSLVELHDGWTVSPVGGGRVPGLVRSAGRIPAAVPGVVHTDLLAAGLIDDPYLDGNEKSQEWIGSTGWRYETEFVWDGADTDRTDLHFLGLDTVAEVVLNGTTILETRNQHRSYRAAVKNLLRDGLNRLEVTFAAPVTEADAASLSLGYRPHVNHHPYNAIRKMACSYGWDWGLDTASSGIWRAVRAESWSIARIDALVVSPTVHGADGIVTVRVQLERADDSLVELVAVINGIEERIEVAGESAQLRLQVPDVRLWWPRGYGEQPLYELVVRVEGADGVIDDAIRRIGFRTVELETAPDSAGTPFTVKINGQPIFVKGVNWIPDDAFPSRVDGSRYAERLEQAADANVNLIRVWGGGIFESDDFYEIADERGLLVWQDFLLACAAYSEDAPMRSEIEAEAREAIIRLGSHPSLVVLNGNNENLWGFEEWGWQPRLEGRSWGALYYYELFPALVAELAPHVGYTPGSPFSPDPTRAVNDPAHGTMHIWDLWNQKDYPHYRDYRPRFVSEFGWQGPPTWSTLVQSVNDAPLTPESPGMLVHQKAADGNVKLTDGLVAHLPMQNTMPDWHWAMSLNQAVAIRTAIEYFRSLQPHCMGSILWQLNDCWPVVSWAAVDGYGKKKPLWYALRDAYSPRLATVQPSGPGLQLALLNDTAEEWADTLDLRRMAFDGTVLAEARVPVRVPARGQLTVPIDEHIARSHSPASELVAAELADERAYWFFAEYRDSELEPSPFDARAELTDEGVRVTVEARGVVRELTVLADIIDPAAESDRALITMLPGDRVVFNVTTNERTDPSRFLQRHVLRSAGQLLHAEAEDEDDLPH